MKIDQLLIPLQKLISTPLSIYQFFLLFRVIILWSMTWNLGNSLIKELIGGNQSNLRKRNKLFNKYENKFRLNSISKNSFYLMEKKKKPLYTKDQEFLTLNQWLRICCPRSLPTNLNLLLKKISNLTVYLKEVT